MSKFERWMFILSAVAVALAVYMGRYELVGGNRPFVLDRWTGNVYVPRLTDAPAPRPYVPGDGP